MLLFDFARIVRFSFFWIFNVFLLSVLFFFLNAFCTPSHNQENHDSK